MNTITLHRNRPQNWPLYSLTILFLLVSCSLPAQQKTDQSFHQMLDGLLDFSVPFVTAKELKALENPVLLDAREKKEYEVSHLEGARWIGYKTFNSQKVSDISKDDTIVIYCSVGYRSEKIGEKLQAQGFKNVYNLYGSIFEWVNEGNEVVNDQGKTEKVHAYDKNWGKWLEKGEKVY